jgi:hypothetical protein
MKEGKTGPEIHEGIMNAGGETARYFNSSLRQKKEPVVNPQQKSGVTKTASFKKIANAGGQSILGQFVLPPAAAAPQEQAEAPMEDDGAGVVNQLVSDVDLKSIKPAINVRSIMGIPEEDD